MKKWATEGVGRFALIGLPVDEAQIVTDRAEDGVEGVAVTALQIAAPRWPSLFMYPITGSRAERRLSSRLMTPMTPRF